MMGFIYPQLGPICLHFLQLLSVWNAMSRMCVYCVCAFLCFVSVWCVCLCVGERLVWPISPRVSTFHNTRHSDGSNTVQAQKPTSGAGWHKLEEHQSTGWTSAQCCQLPATISCHMGELWIFLWENSSTLWRQWLYSSRWIGWTSTSHGHSHCAVEKG